MPISVIASDATHVDPEDQADMLHGNFGQDAMKSTPDVCYPSGLSLIVVDDQDTISGPSQSDREFGEFVLPLP
jgi:hypothetical protein